MLYGSLNKNVEAVIGVGAFDSKDVRMGRYENFH